MEAVKVSDQMNTQKTRKQYRATHAPTCMLQSTLHASCVVKSRLMCTRGVKWRVSYDMTLHCVGDEFWTSLEMNHTQVNVAENVHKNCGGWIHVAWMWKSSLVVQQVVSPVPPPPPPNYSQLLYMHWDSQVQWFQTEGLGASNGSRYQR